MANPLSRFLVQQPGQVPVQSDVAPSQGLNQQMLNGLQNMVNMFNGSNQKEAVMQALASANPQMAEIMQLCNGRNPKEVFVEGCRQRGIDPQYALTIMSRIGIQ